MVMPNSNWELYSDIRSKIAELAPDFKTGAIRKTDLLGHLEIRIDDITGLEADLEGICLAKSLSGRKLFFTCDTQSSDISHSHTLKITDVDEGYSIPSFGKTRILNREKGFFARRIYNVLQALFNYASRQESFVELDREYGLTSLFGKPIEEIERKYNVPSLGTKDIVGSFLRHVYLSNIPLDGKSLFE